MSRQRVIPCLVALLLALAPSAASAQGAGDDQYQDPFGEQPTAQQNGQDDGLSDEPPGGGGSDDATGGSGGSGDGGGSGGNGNGDTGGNGGSTAPPNNGLEDPPVSTPREDPSALPNTGADPRPLALLGAAFFLLGLGLRLRTIDPDAY